MSENIITQISKGQDILGEAIAWQLKGTKTTYHQLVNAFRDAGLDDNVVRTKLPRNAFTQAMKRLLDKRVIDKLGEDEADIRFQFTRKYRENGEFEYVREYFMTLSKSTGRVYCEENPELADLAEKMVSELLDTYTGPNIAHYLRDLFEGYADIFSYPDDGGVYLVPVVHQDFIEKVEKFCNIIGGRLKRLPIAKGTEYGDRAFREAISSQIEKTAQNHIKAVEKLTPDNQDRTFEARAREINETRYKIEVYAAYLGSESQKLLQVVADARKVLREKILEASANACAD